MSPRQRLVGNWDRRQDLDLLNRPAWVIRGADKVVRINQDTGEVVLTELEDELTLVSPFGVDDPS